MPVIFLAVLVTGIVVPATPASAEVTFTGTIVNHSAGTCAEVPGGASTSALQLAQAACGAGARQTFTFTPVAGVAATYNVRTLTAGSCVDVSGASAAVVHPSVVESVDGWWHASGVGYADVAVGDGGWCGG